MTPPKRPEWVWNPSDSTDDEDADGAEPDGDESTESDDDGGAS